MLLFEHNVTGQKKLINPIITNIHYFIALVPGM